MYQTIVQECLGIYYQSQINGGVSFFGQMWTLHLVQTSSTSQESKVSSTFSISERKTEPRIIGQALVLEGGGFWQSDLKVIFSVFSVYAKKGLSGSELGFHLCQLWESTVFASLALLTHSHKSCPQGLEIIYLHPGRQSQCFVNSSNKILNRDLGLP